MGDEDYSYMDDGYNYNGGYDPGGGYNPGGDYDSGGGSTNYQNYMPGGAEYIPPGSGYYQVDGGPRQPVQSSYSPEPSYNYGQQAPAPQTYRAPQTYEAPSGGDYVGGGRPPSGGQRQPSYQRPSLGAPERTLYDRYSKMLQNPALMAGDPAYQFLFNQGMQAFNRTAGANRMRGAGATAAGATQYGQGMAFDYMNKLLPQYRGGAQEELSRFMGPSGLQGQYAQIGNQASQMEGAEQGARDLLPYYDRQLSGGGYSGGPSQGAFLPTGAGYGGGGGMQQYPQRLGGAENDYSSPYPDF